MGSDNGKTPFVKNQPSCSEKDEPIGRWIERGKEIERGNRITNRWKEGRRDWGKRRSRERTECVMET